MAFCVFRGPPPSSTSTLPGLLAARIAAASVLYSPLIPPSSTRPLRSSTCTLRCAGTARPLQPVAYPGYVSTMFPSSPSCLLYVGGGTFTSAAALNFNSSPPLCPPPTTTTSSPSHARVNVFPCDRRGWWVGGGALLITMQCRQPAVWTDTPPSVCLCVFYLGDSENYQNTCLASFF